MLHVHIDFASTFKTRALNPHFQFGAFSSRQSATTCLSSHLRLALLEQSSVGLRVLGFVWVLFRADICIFADAHFPTLIAWILVMH